MKNGLKVFTIVCICFFLVGLLAPIRVVEHPHSAKSQKLEARQTTEQTRFVHLPEEASIRLVKNLQTDTPNHPVTVTDTTFRSQEFRIFAPRLSVSYFYHHIRPLPIVYTEILTI